MALHQTLALTVEDAGRLEAAAVLLEKCAPQEIIKWAFNQFAGGLAIATGFGAEGVAMIDMAVKINPRPDIFFIDTDFLFPETYELRRRIEERYGIEIRAARPELTPQAQELELGPRLWSRDPDLCCRVRKLEPLKDALKGLSAWMTAIRRDQTRARATARMVEWDYLWQLVKVNPLAAWTKREVWDYIVKNDVPYNPLHDEGYPSIGCTHCTRSTAEGEAERAGRWSGQQKTECGLHALPQQSIASNSFEV
ncbi:MAG TPA: phosphoadenylyl-sulfate reductase [Blastocatellia bacterium]|nr:phosphoadenylyl-sulfate reductase [Blastocatellia bacterium]